MAVGASTSLGAPVIGCYLNTEKRFAFVEFRNVEEASNAMAFDGVGCQVRVQDVPDDLCRIHLRCLHCSVWCCVCLGVGLPAW
jgi:hypothetical protein